MKFEVLGTVLRTVWWFLLVSVACREYRLATGSTRRQHRNHNRTIAVYLNSGFHFEVLLSILGIVTSREVPDRVSSSEPWPYVGYNNVILGQNYLSDERKDLLLSPPSLRDVNITFVYANPRLTEPNADYTIIVTTYTYTGSNFKSFQVAQSWPHQQNNSKMVFLCHSVPPPDMVRAYDNYNLWYLSPHAGKLGLRFILPSYLPPFPSSLSKKFMLPQSQGRLVLITQGQITHMRRDYFALFAALKTLSHDFPSILRAIQVYVIGSGKTMSPQLKEAMEKAEEDGLVVCLAGLNDTAFFASLAQADAFLPLVHKHLEQHRPYFENKLSSSFSLALSLGVSIIGQAPLFQIYRGVDGVAYRNHTDLPQAIVSFVLSKQGKTTHVSPARDRDGRGEKSPREHRYLRHRTGVVTQALSQRGMH